MFLLPIGHEEHAVRRVPVVTFGIMAICVVAFIASGRGAYESESALELSSKAEEAFAYYWEHPYLEIDDEFEIAAYGEADAIENEFREFAEGVEGLAADPGGAATVAKEQAELDRLTDAVLEARGEHTFFRWGLIPAHFSVIGLVTHMFMHGGWLHLIGNLLILYLLGPYVEDVWGRPLFAGFYFLSGCAAAFAFIGFNLGSEVPMVGASGAIAGVMGAFLVHYHRTKIKFFYIIGLFWRGTFDAAAWVMLPMWFGEQLFLAVAVATEGSGVAYWAHVGGFAFGLGVALAVKRAAILERYVQPQLDQACGESVLERPGLEAALAARELGDHDGAFELLGAELHDDPRHADTAELYWETAAQLDRRAETLPLMLISLQAQLRNGETESVRSMWERIVEVDPTIEADPTFLIRLAQVQIRLADRDGARQTLRRTLLSAGATPPAGLALKIARLGAGLDKAIARGVLRALIARPDIGLEDRRAAEGLLAGLSATPVSAPAEREEQAEPLPLTLG